MGDNDFSFIITIASAVVIIGIVVAMAVVTWALLFMLS